ncbi:hypothetical protein ACFPYI_09790 [Halomarina salina]|uniref:Protein NO VEIN C-terminal domain-containing protein n=1 Tax=Halomarina salina TaxID=1872699 RepID=A0ABD5RLZ3_9EURY|nr:hypothetical protein [Halomarina salina]
MTWRDSWPGDPEFDDEVSVAIKPSAVRDCGVVESYAEEHGEVVQFTSVEAAREELTRHRTSAELSLQRVAPNDPAEVEWYLVSLGQHGYSADERGPPDEGWTFDPTANQYGAFGEALFTATPHGTRPLKQFVHRDLGIDDALRVRVDSSPPVVSNDAGTWHPDVAAAVRLRWGPDVQRYLFEVKTGTGELERTQEATMREHARSQARDRVVHVVADIAGLPEEYSVEFHAVG